MSQYEFKRVFHAEGRSYSQGSLEDKLNHYGKEGWQVVNCQLLEFDQVRTDENHGHGVRLETRYHILLQREVPDSGL